MKCARVQDLLMLYLAGELGAKETDRLLAHLASCDRCTALAEDLAATEERVANILCTHIEPPATLDARVMTAVRALPPHPTSWPRFMPGWGRRPQFVLAAALACLALIGLGVMRRPSAASGLELASLGQEHSRLLTVALTTELHDTDPQRLAQQLTPDVPFPVRAADLKPEGVGLVGGSRTTVDHVPVVMLHYEWQGKRISLFEMERAKRTPTPLQQLGQEPDSYYVRKAGNTAYVAWHSGKTDCVMVAQSVPMHQLFHLACRACERQERL